MNVNMDSHEVNLVSKIRRFYPTVADGAGERWMGGLHTFGPKKAIH